MDANKNQVDRFLDWARGHPVVGPAILVGLVVVSLSAVLEAVDKIGTFYNHHVSTRKKSYNVLVLPSEKLSYVPRLGENSQSPVRLGLSICNSNSSAFVINPITLEMFNPASSSFERLDASLADGSGTPLDVPLSLFPSQQVDLVFSFPPPKALLDDIKLRLTAYPQDSSDRLVASVEFKRLTNGYEGSLQVNGRYSDFTELVAPGASGSQVMASPPATVTAPQTPGATAPAPPVPDSAASGTAVSADAARYHGDSRNGVPDGAGTYVWPNGEKYEGHWKNGQQDGLGTYIWPDGTRFAGEWKAGRQTVAATNTWPDGRLYTGGMSNGRREGVGIMIFANREKYDGQWRDSQPEGPGTYYWPDGTVYSGAFHLGKMNGRGRMTYSNGHVDDGYWQDAKFLGAQPPGNGPSSANAR